MKVGWIGLGKLGLPCALTMAAHGHHVCGTDVDRRVKHMIQDKRIPYQEAGVDVLFRAGYTINWKDTIVDVLDESDIVFVAVQTPHAPEYEGITRVPHETRDFDYSYLESAVKEIATHAAKPVTVVIVSTVLPGTTRRLLLPHVNRNSNIRLIYSPCFIAMGTASLDWQKPAIVLCGGGDPVARKDFATAMGAMHKAPIMHMSIESAEMAKVLYNTFISMKIVFANTAMEIAEIVGANCDDVSNALSHATDRITSGAYLRGGMGDGGGCHPRDNIALSHLAKTAGLSVDPFSWLMDARHRQTQWLAKQVYDWHLMHPELPVVLCGAEYKPSTNLTTGSPAILLENILFDDYAIELTVAETHPTTPSIFIIGCKHPWFERWKWPPGSFVLDPHGYIRDQSGVVVRRIGRR